MSCSGGGRRGGGGGGGRRRGGGGRRRGGGGSEGLFLQPAQAIHLGQGGEGEARRRKVL